MGIKATRCVAVIVYVCFGICVVGLGARLGFGIDGSAVVTAVDGSFVFLKRSCLFLSANRPVERSDSADFGGSASLRCQ